jgi:hypothetical protein
MVELYRFLYYSLVWVGLSSHHAQRTRLGLGIKLYAGKAQDMGLHTLRMRAKFINAQNGVALCYGAWCVPCNLRWHTGGRDVAGPSNKGAAQSMKRQVLNLGVL